MTQTVAEIMEEAPILPPEATGETAYEVFSDDPDLMVCAVVDRGQPLGLLTRDRFFLRMADRYGRALYSRRPVGFVMQNDPLAVEHDTPVDRLNAHILEARPGALMDGFVVTREGRYLGVGSSLGLFSAAVRAVNERSERLETLTGELTEAERAARESARAKAEFLAMMSHEIRTPLNGVLGLSALLARSDLPADQSDLARAIHESGTMLLTLLNDILDLSRLEAGRCELHREPFALEALAEEMRQLWQADARERGLAYEVAVEDADGGKLVADAGRLRQVLINLIGNALKFTPQGEVRVRLIAEDGRLRMEVADTGIGVPAEAREAIFEEFRQADSSYVRRYGGAGLGLAICSRLVKLMDGRIGFDSRSGAGSVFWAEVPAPRAGARAEAA